MRPSLGLISCVIVLSASTLHAQTHGSRSADYLFVSTAADARALWVNPAGTQLGARASLVGELVLDRSLPDTARISQWSVGLSSRAFSFGYQRDRLPGGSANQSVRIGLASRFSRGAVGAATTFYKADSTSRGVDLGITYALSPPVTLGVVVRHIGRPSVRADRLPVTGVVGLGWTAPGRRFQLATEILAAERLARSGYDMSYRAGANLSLGRELPFAAIVAFQFDKDFDVRSWSVGLTVGGDRRAVAIGTISRTDGSSDVDLLSLTGVALNRGVAGR